MADPSCQNHCINQLNSSWFRKRTSIDDWSAIPSEGKREDTELLMQLPVKFRESMYLYYYEGYSVREISRILGRKESTIQSQLAAGREKLRRQMGECGMEG